MIAIPITLVGAKSGPSLFHTHSIWRSHHGFANTSAGFERISDHDRRVWFVGHWRRRLGFHVGSAGLRRIHLDYSARFGIGHQLDRDGPDLLHWPIRWNRRKARS